MNEVLQQLQVVMKMVAGLQQEVRTLRQELQTAKSRNEMWTVQDVCDYAHVGRTYVMTALKEGRLPFAVKTGNKWLFDVEKTKQVLGKTVVYDKRRI